MWLRHARVPMSLSLSAHKPLAVRLLALAALLAAAHGCRRQAAPAPPAEESAPAPPAPAPPPVVEPLVAPVAASPAMHEKDPCQAVCAHGRQLGCRKSMADCRKGCTEALGEESCASPRRRFGDCLGREPRAHWACDEEGMPALADGFCAPERSALALCLKGEAR
jgi:hypothetical protein